MGICSLNVFCIPLALFYVLILYRYDYVHLGIAENNPLQGSTQLGVPVPCLKTNFEMLTFGAVTDVEVCPEFGRHGELQSSNIKNDFVPDAKSQIDGYVVWGG